MIHSEKCGKQYANHKFNDTGDVMACRMRPGGVAVSSVPCSAGLESRPRWILVGLQVFGVP